MLILEKNHFDRHIDYAIFNSWFLTSESTSTIKKKPFCTKYYANLFKKVSIDPHIGSAILNYWFLTADSASQPKNSSYTDINANLTKAWIFAHFWPLLGHCETFRNMRYRSISLNRLEEPISFVYHEKTALFILIRDILRVSLIIRPK